MSLRGLWEEEETLRRRRQMIPEGVHKPPRSKILNRKPIPGLNPHNAQTLARAILSLRSTSSPTLPHSEDENQNIQEGRPSPSSTKTGQSPSDTEALTKKKHGPSAPATVRSQALSEGYDLNEYKPWRDGTVTPHQGSFHSLRQLRRTMLGPWPAEESRAKDECTRILHRMREQLNVVINLQIHLRSMIKTVPAHMSFLLSIRHPGQVSIELLNALYGPQFMQSSAFRAIEQLLWGRKQPQRIEHHQQPQQQSAHHSPHSSSHQYQDSQYHGRHYSGQADAMESSIPERSYHHYQQDQGDLMEEDECAFEEAFDEPAYQDPMLGLDHTVGDDSKTLGRDHIANDRRLHGHSSLHKAFYTPQDDGDEDVEELAVLSPRMELVSTGQLFD
ncbi:hypothetical protein BGZ70_007494 [Mortierella alpina]|uniref:Uncharacterized protein n=1 Tax=Mortierella alpina TaxID=64518 RepID=A0A9P6JDK0_MORAP|nr:hypothetical protein BGZ70_007494 [Mortierella alpina]